MKKILLFISLLLCANIMFAQTTATLTMPDIDVSGYNAGDEVLVPINVEAISNMVEGFQVFLGFDDDIMTWNGTNTGPAPGVNSIFSGLTPLGPDWLWNNNVVDELAFSWVEPTFYNPVTIPAGENLIVLSFTYHGGLNPGDVMPIIFGQPAAKQMSDDGTMVKWGPTELYDEFFGIYELTLNDGSLFVPGGVTGKTWNGSISNSWFQDPDNWTPPGTPTATDDVTIPAGTPNSPVVHDHLVFECNNLIIDDGATLTIDWNGYLTTNGDLENNGTFVILTDELGVPFSEGGSYINMGAIGGTGTFESTRNVVCTGTVAGSDSDAGWHYLSAPFDGFTTDDLPNYFVNAWDQPNGMWMQYSMDPITDPCTPWPVTDLLAADAWSINADADYDFNYNDPNNPCFGTLAPTTGTTLEFSSLAGGVHTGTYNVPVGYGAAGFEMFELVGNPYPSGVELMDLVWGSDMQQSVYLWLGCSADYFEWTPAMGLQPIGINQGFFVQSTASSPNAFIEFNDAARAHGGLGFTKSEVTDLLTLQASGNDASDLLHVRFMDGMTAGNDLNGDAPKLFVETEGLPQIYTTALGEKMAINALPATSMVPMGFTCATSGEYTISAIETSEFDNVVLEDLVTGEQTDLLTNSYTFNYTVNDDADRFMIHFTPLGIGDNSAASIQIWSNDRKIFVQSPDISGDIAVFNMMGQEVIRAEIEPGLNTIPVNDGNAYYVVKVIGSDVAKTGKVYVK